MNNSTNRQTLLTEQYKTTSNLLARITLHERFSTNSYDWFRWVFDHLNLSPNALILELGCGTGKLWVKNSDRVPATWNITLSDLSPGMVNESRNSLQHTDLPIKYINCDAQNLPIPNGFLDAVIANHMLYHISDRSQAILEIHRVIKSGGVLYCATNGENHLKELDDFYDLIQPKIKGFISRTFSADAFTIENGAAQLSPYFKTSLDCYEDSLEVTDPQALLSYILSMVSKQDLERNQAVASDLLKIIEDRISKDKHIHISKVTGLFIAQKLK